MWRQFAGVEPRKLTGHPLFGALGHVPFQQVFDRASQDGHES